MSEWRLVRRESRAPGSEQDGRMEVAGAGLEQALGGSEVKLKLALRLDVDASEDEWEWAMAGLLDGC